MSRATLGKTEQLHPCKNFADLALNRGSVCLRSAGNCCLAEMLLQAGWNYLSWVSVAHFLAKAARIFNVLWYILAISALAL